MTYPTSTGLTTPYLPDLAETDPAMPCPAEPAATYLAKTGLTTPSLTCPARPNSALPRLTCQDAPDLDTTRPTVPALLNTELLLNGLPSFVVYDLKRAEPHPC